MELFISNIIPSFACFGGLCYLDKSKSCRPVDLFVISLGLGPAITVLILYYMLLLVPGQSSLFYFSTILTVYSIILILALKSISENIKKTFHSACSFYANHKFQFYCWVMIVLTFSITWFYWCNTALLADSDVLEYATQAKIFNHTHAIVYDGVRFNDQTCYLYVALHGFSFPLFGTWNFIIGDVLQHSNDLYFKSISGYYLLMLAVLIFITLYRIIGKNKDYAFLGVLFLFLAPVSLEFFCFFTIDTFRVYFLTAGMIVFLRYMYMPNKFLLTLFGIIGGIMVNSHAIGAIFMPWILISMIIFLKSSFFSRIKNVLYLCLIILLFGGIHYILQVLWGDGWLYPRYIYENNYFRGYFRVFLSNRGIGGLFELIINGYLGQWFRINMFGVLAWIIIPILCYLVLVFRKITQLEKVFVFNYIYFALIISVKGYYNFRYQYTLLPLTIIAIMYSLSKLNVTQPFHNKKINRILWILFFGSILHFVVINGLNVKSYVKRYAVAPCKQPSDFVSRTFNPIGIIEYIKNIELNYDQNIMSCDSKMLYYYSDKPILYYGTENDCILTKKGALRLFATSSDTDVLKLLSLNNIAYIVINKKYYIINNEMNRFAFKYCRLMFDDDRFAVFMVPRETSK